MDDIDEDKILAGLSAKELQQLQNEMDDTNPDKTVPVGMREDDAPDEASTQGCCFFCYRVPLLIFSFCLFFSIYSLYHTL